MSKRIDNFSKISVAICVYNGAEVIRKAIESVLNQIVLPYELMIVDDGSEDELEDVLAQYSHPILRHVKKEHSGLAKTRNHALQSARGDFVAFMDADDWYTPGYFEEIRATIIDTKADLIYAGSRYYNVDNSIRDEQILGISGSQENYERLLRIGNYIAVSTVTARVSTLLDIGGFHENLRVNCGCEDWDMWIRASGNEAKIEFIPKILVEKRFNPVGPYFRDPKAYRKDMMEVIDRGLALNSEFSREFQRLCLANMYYVWAGIERLNNNWVNVVKFLLLGIVSNFQFPFRIFRRIVNMRKIRNGKLSFDAYRGF